MKKKNLWFRFWDTKVGTVLIVLMALVAMYFMWWPDGPPYQQ